MQESKGYPTSTTRLPTEVFNRLTELPCGIQMNVEWFQKHVWSDTTEFSIPESQVICGMQANIYKIIYCTTIFFEPMSSPSTHKE